jgi:hypothetical protein
VSPKSSKEGSPKKLSTGGVVGIIIGSTAIAGFGIFMIVRAMKQPRNDLGIYF